MTNDDCFVIMPITTPDDHCGRYKNDSEHFIHVMDYLFKPAIIDAGLNPIFPINKGSEIIHADIISNIESSDLVLCDMSILNANVFFELGIRTALNKPVCLIKDDATEKVPFDTTIINNHTYSCKLDPWLLDAEIKKLSSHIEATLSKSGNVNSLWRYFSLSSIAHSVEPKESGDSIEYLNMQMESMRNQFDKILIKLDHQENITTCSSDSKDSLDGLKYEIMKFLSKMGIAKYRIWSEGSILLLMSNKIDSKIESSLGDIGFHNGYGLKFDKENDLYYFNKMRQTTFDDM